MASVFTLPSSVSAYIFSQWCAVKDLMNFDSAICNSKNREVLLNLVQLPGFMVHESLSINKILWTAAKKIKPLKLGFRKSDLSNIPEEIDFSKVNSISFTDILSGDHEKISVVVNSCPILLALKFTVSDAGCNSTFIDLKKSKQKMSTITLFDTISSPILAQLKCLIVETKDSIRLNSNAYATIAVKCTNLLHLELISAYTDYDNKTNERSAMKIIASNKNLQVIKLGNFAITNFSITTTAKHCPFILEMVFIDVRDAFALKWETFIKSCRYLSKLNIYDHTTQENPYLMYQKVNGTHSLIFAGEVEDSKVCPILQVVSYQSLHFIYALSNITINYIANNMVNTLEKLTVDPICECTFTNEDMTNLLTKCAKLHTLSLRFHDNGELIKPFLKGLSEAHNLRELSLFIEPQVWPELDTKLILDVVHNLPKLKQIKWPVDYFEMHSSEDENLREIKQILLDRNEKMEGPTF